MKPHGLRLNKLTAEVARVLIASGDESAARIYELVSLVRSYY